MSVPTPESSPTCRAQRLTLRSSSWLIRPKFTRVFQAFFIIGTCLIMLQLHWLREQSREHPAARSLEELDGRVYRVWRLRPSIGVTQFPCYQPLQWLLPGDSRVEGVRLDNVRSRQLDTALVAFESLPHLKFITLSNARITDAALMHVGGLRSLVLLDLSKTPITDSGVRNLATVLSLERLDLSHTLITDAGLSPIAELCRLRWLNLVGTAVTTKRVALLHRQLPGTQILSDINDPSLAVPSDDSLARPTALPRLRQRPI